jgi:riboflavin synthase
MFTGLIQAIGVVKRVSDSPEGKTLAIQCPGLIGDIAVDDSIAVNGVCLTATQLEPDGFIAQAIHTTLEKTTIGLLRPAQRVNLELAMRASDRLGGHLVQGHVNAVGRIAAIETRGQNWLIQVDFPPGLRKYMISEGSVTIDGISLTIAELSDSRLTVSIIPHTLSHTTLSDRLAGDAVNIEVDIMAKYIENFLRLDPALAGAWTQPGARP